MNTKKERYFYLFIFLFFGSYILNNGDKYVGEWENGFAHGQGTYSYKNGDQENGKWSNDKFID